MIYYLLLYNISCVLIDYDGSASALKLAHLKGLLVSQLLDPGLGLRPLNSKDLLNFLAGRRIRSLILPLPTILRLLLLLQHRQHVPIVLPLQRLDLLFEVLGALVLLGL